MNTTQHAELQPALASGISDRAFRLYCALVLTTTGEWTAIPKVAAECRITPHQARGPLTQLVDKSLIERERVYETGSSGRKTWHTYVRLIEDATEVREAA
ncbi:hypothetical protein ACIP9H_33590 [Streptomyces sp. NPDC088732]|uniref:hypothetical protein n=1 Tax=Streptomyces sp. NPDC088732 TaxID=3365879 RepID=UPI0037FB332C